MALAPTTFLGTVAAGAASGAASSAATQITQNVLTPCAEWHEGLLGATIAGGVAGGVTAGLVYGVGQWLRGRTPVQQLPVVRESEPATVRELVDMLNKRPDVRAAFAEGDRLEMMRAIQAEGSHGMKDGVSEIFIREEVATRRSVLHEWVHHVIQERNGGNYTPGEDKFIEDFLSRLKNTLRLE